MASSSLLQLFPWCKLVLAVKTAVSTKLSGILLLFLDSIIYANDLNWSRANQDCHNTILVIVCLLLLLELWLAVQT